MAQLGYLRFAKITGKAAKRTHSDLDNKISALFNTVFSSQPHFGLISASLASDLDEAETRLRGTDRKVI